MVRRAPAHRAPPGDDLTFALRANRAALVELTLAQDQQDSGGTPAASEALPEPTVPPRSLPATGGSPGPLVPIGLAAAAWILGRRPRPPAA